MATMMLDSKPTFGTLPAAASGTFPNDLNLLTWDRGRTISKKDNSGPLPATDLNRLCVFVQMDGVAGATGGKVTVSGSVDGSSGWTDVGTSTFTSVVNPIRVAISPNDFQYLRVAFTLTGTITAGNMTAYIDTYFGK
jgi:hypothetical protein